MRLQPRLLLLLTGVLALMLAVIVVTQPHPHFTALIGGSVLFIALLGLMLSLGIRCYITRPLAALEQTVNAIASGDLSRLAGDLPGEFGQLAIAFNGMAETLMQEHAQLATSEIRYTATFEQAAVGIALVAPDGRWQRVNRRLCDIVGYSEAELFALTFQDITHPDDLELDLGQVRRMLAKEIETYSMEKRYIRKDSSLIWINLTVALVRKTDGTPDYFISVVEDIQQRKSAEADIQRLNAHLEQRVIERTAELTAANQELDSFAYAVSHDLRAPLRAMSGFSQALQEDYGDQLQGETKLFLKQIDIAGHKMNELVDGLLALSRSTRGELQHDVVDLSAMAERLLAELAQGEPERKVTIKVESDLQTHGDARMIEVVMRNLLSNAWKYSSQAAAASIRVYAETRQGEQYFCVADNGAGFDMVYASRLFQPFQRLHRQEEFPGIGIGLATVQRIVRRHGGVIEARGLPGKGATFCFSLAAAMEAK